MDEAVGDTSPGPNVIWVLVDQMSGQATGYAGDPNVHTPNLDRLAAEGHVFGNAVAGAPLCCPARGSLLTGRYPVNSGVAGHCHPMPATTPTVATILRDAGYRTCWIGKWHLDGDRPELGLTGDENARVRMIPPDRRGGFTDWWAYENNNRPFDCLVHTDSGRSPAGTPLVRAAEGMEQFRLPGYESDALTDLLLSWLDDQTAHRPQTPFFAVLSMQPPHNPYVAPAPDMARHTPGQVRLRPNVPEIPAVRAQARRELAGYYAAIERIDANLGRLRRRLEHLGLSENTYLVFLSDHGDMHGSHGQWRKTAPWEEAIRVPCIIGGPSREHQDPHRPAALFNQVDLAPTTLGLCGLSTPDWMEGTDYLRGDPATHIPDSAYIGLPVPTGHSNSIDRPWRGLITSDGWKYVELDDAPWLMFNLTEDPYELVNHAHNPAYRDRRRDLQALLRDWTTRIAAAPAPP